MSTKWNSSVCFYHRFEQLTLNFELKFPKQNYQWHRFLFDWFHWNSTIKSNITKHNSKSFRSSKPVDLLRELDILLLEWFSTKLNIFYLSFHIDMHIQNFLISKFHLTKRRSRVDKHYYDWSMLFHVEIVELVSIERDLRLI